MFGLPMLAVLFHHGAFSADAVRMTTLAVQGYGVGLVGLIGVKVLAPGFYAQQDIRTPVRIAVVVLVLTQLMNAAFVPWLGHAGLALSTSLGATLNAGWLLRGLRQRALHLAQRSRIGHGRRAGGAGTRLIATPARARPPSRPRSRVPRIS